MAIVTFYRNHPNPPKTTQRTRLGANALIVHNGKLLLEKRSDCDLWGLVGGGVRRKETTLQAITREIWEEIGLRIPQEKLRKLAVYDGSRIAAYQNGSVWKMVIVAYWLELEELPTMQISKESRQLRFFSKEELENIEIVVTHSDIIEQWFMGRENL